MEILHLLTKYNLPNEFILTVGHLEKRKNYLRLIRAIDILKKNNENVNLIIVGQDSDESENIYKLILKKMIRSIYKKNVTLDDLINLNTKNSSISLIIKAIDNGIGNEKVTIGLIREQINQYPNQLTILDRIRG